MFETTNQIWYGLKGWPEIIKESKGKSPGFQKSARRIEG